MKRSEFEKLVEQAVHSLPRQFRQKLDNVEIVIESWPNPQILKNIGIGSAGLLFGLYQGTPKPIRTKGSIFPDKITIFAGPIIAVSRTPEEVKEKVASVVKHEIAHHFGLDEVSIRKTGH